MLDYRACYVSPSSSIPLAKMSALSCGVAIVVMIYFLDNSSVTWNRIGTGLWILLTILTYTYAYVFKCQRMGKYADIYCI